MRLHIILVLLVASFSSAQEPDASTMASLSSNPAPVRTEFHVRYVSGANVYIDGGRSAGLTEDEELILKQDPTKSATDPSNLAIEPGVVARLKVISVASTSSVCEVVSTKRDVAENDVVSVPDTELKKMVEKDAIGSSRHYPMVISFNEGDPLDEEVRDAVPRPPLPEVNERQGRIGFDQSMITELGQNGAASSEYGMVFRADFTRLFGTHWNLNGYWRGSLQSSSAPAQQTLQDSMNRTYLMSLTYVNPQASWTAGIGRLFLPWASSLQTIDGGYFGKLLSSKTVLSVFGGSTPDPTAWDYNPQRKIFGSLFNVHGGSFENIHISSTTGAGVELLNWDLDRPFVFTENEFSFKRYFFVYHSMQLDKPTANPGTAPVGAGLGQSLFSLRVQAIHRVTFDLTHTYFRDVPTYSLALAGTGLLDKYLYQGVNGGVRVELPFHLVAYTSLGDSNNSNDKKVSLNEMLGATITRIWKTGVMIDARYSKFDSSFASGTYKTLTLTRDLGDRLRLDLQGGRYAYAATLATNNNSYFVNAMLDSNLGARFFIQSQFTTERGGTQNYNQFTNVIGYRFDNRAAMRKAAHSNQQ